MRIKAFLYRNTLEALSYKSSFVLDSAAMAFQIVTFFFISKLISESQYFPFVLLGMTFSLYQSTALQSLAGVIAREQESGTLEMILVTAPIQQILSAGFVWHLLFTSARIILYLAGGWLLFGGKIFLMNLPALLATIVLMQTSLLGIGLFSAGYILLHKRGDPTTFLINGFSKFFSGIFFPVSVLPAGAQTISNLIPLSHALSAFRKILLENASFQQVLPELGALLLFSIVLLPAGYFAFRWFYRQTLREGSLSYR